VIIFGYLGALHEPTEGEGERWNREKTRNGAKDSFFGKTFDD
jgi:hypothetical protein